MKVDCKNRRSNPPERKESKTYVNGASRYTEQELVRQQELYCGRPHPILSDQITE